MALFRNATPNMYFTGYKDTPKPGLQDGSVATPLHLPLSLVNTAWGPVDEPLLCMGTEFNTQFGAESWDVRGNFFNHQSLFASLFFKKGNAQYVKRMNTDAKEAYARVFLEYVAAELPVYERDEDGTFIVGSDGNHVAVTPPATTAGFKVRYGIEYPDDFNFGKGTKTDGTYTGEGAKGRIPLFDIKATYGGTRGNNFNINIFQPGTEDPVKMDLKSVKATGDMQYRLMVSETPEAGGTATPWYTNMSTMHMDFAIGEDKYSTLGRELSFDEVYRAQYILDNQRYSGLNKTGPIDHVHVYDAFAEEFLTLVHTAELAAQNAAVAGGAVAPKKAYIHATNVMSINLLGDVDFDEIPYSALALDTVEAGYYEPMATYAIKLKNGTDGDLTLDTFDAAVSAFCTTFGQASPNLADLKRFPFHFIWDSGFKEATKKKLAELTNKRPDLFVPLCTFVEGEDMLSAADESAMALSLTANPGISAESAIYKTEATRATVMPWCVRLRNNPYKKPTTLNYDFAEKVSDYLGSADGQWVTAKAVDTYPNNVIKHELLNYEYLQLPVREDMWANQMVAVEYGDVNEIIYSGIQTVQPNESSVLNSFPVVAACMHATWACIKTNRLFVGQSISNGMLIKRSNEEVARLCSGIDKAKAIVTPWTEITPEDNDAGYAWHTGADVQGNGMKTVNTVEIRSSWLEA